jgi:hypothetical protein
MELASAAENNIYNRTPRGLVDLALYNHPTGYQKTNRDTLQALSASTSSWPVLHKRSASTNMLDFNRK